jgi:hypothetical protein
MTYQVDEKDLKVVIRVELGIEKKYAAWNMSYFNCWQAYLGVCSESLCGQHGMLFR